MRAAIDKYAMKVSLHNSVNLGKIQSPKTAIGVTRSKNNSPEVERQHLQTAGMLKKVNPPFKVKKTALESFQSTAAETVPTSRMGHATNTMIRRDHWVDFVKNDADLLNTIAKGSQSLIHPSNISFREKSNNANIYIRNHMTSADRASLAQFQYEQNHLPNTLYKKDDPLRKYFLRPKVPTNETQSAMRYQAQSQNQRIQEAISGQLPVNLDQFDLDQYKSPVYKKVQKNLWKSKDGFSIKQTNDGKHVWTQQDVGTLPAKEPYYASLKKIGQEAMGRHRRRNRELRQDLQFEGTVRNDNWSCEFTQTKSLRSGQSLNHQIKTMKKLSALNLTSNQMPMVNSQESVIQNGDDSIGNDSQANMVFLKDLGQQQDNLLGTSIQQHASNENLQHTLINKSIGSIQEEDESISPRITSRKQKRKEVNLMQVSKPLKNKNRTKVTKLESSFLESSQGSAKAIKVFDMWKQNPNIYVDTSQQGDLRRQSFNSQYQKQGSKQLNDTMIQMSLQMPKSYHQSLTQHIIKPKFKISESQNKFPDKVKLQLPPGTLGQDEFDTESILSKSQQFQSSKLTSFQTQRHEKSKNIMNQIKERILKQQKSQEKHVINSFLLDTMNQTQKSYRSKDKVDLIYNKQDCKLSDLSKSFHDKFNISKKQIYGSPYTTAREIKKQMNMSVHHHLRENNSREEIESNLESMIRQKNPNIDRFSPIIEGEETYEMYMQSQRNTKQKIKPLKMTPSQKDLMKIVKVIQNSQKITPGSSVMLQKKSISKLRNSRLCDQMNQSMDQGSLDGGNSIYSIVDQQDSVILSDKVNPKFRKTQVKKIVGHYFK